MVNPAPHDPTPREVLPDLRIVPIGSLVPHEIHDDQRSAPLIKRIEASGVWLNPPIVAPMDDERYVILDGANRHHCLKTLGYPYILVQVVDYESGFVKLETWHHIVSGMSWFEFLRRLREVPALTLNGMDLLTARAALARREVLAYTVLADNRAYTLAAEAVTLADRTRVLNEIVDAYKTRGVLNRINTDQLSTARKLYPDAVAIIVFPRYEPPEIVVAARDGVHLPPGISRHIIYGRAMRLHYPLSALRDDGETLEAKNAALQLWVQERTAAKRIRYYAEPTYLFDE
ncbi:MAG TPA: ParB N-terminal domain-containing protein [Aggregatilineales bacterium]|nr:ParB N-terminal domain-containing protein [Anaerolineales bacterium]HRE49106.1 ParB N-terminal domain-containing protein [Aggregatilineales bacterium]